MKVRTKWNGSRSTAKEIRGTESTKPYSLSRLFTRGLGIETQADPNCAMEAQLILDAFN